MHFEIIENMLQYASFNEQVKIHIVCVLEQCKWCSFENKNDPIYKVNDLPTLDLMLCLFVCLE